MFSSFTKSISNFVAENIVEEASTLYQSTNLETNRSQNQRPSRASQPASANVSRQSSPGTANARSSSSSGYGSQRNPRSRIGSSSYPESDSGAYNNPVPSNAPNAPGSQSSTENRWSTQEKLLIDHLGLNSKQLEGMTKYELVQIAAVHAEMQQLEKGGLDLDSGPCIESMLLSQIVDIPGLTQSDLMHLSPKEIAKIAAVSNQSDNPANPSNQPNSTKPAGKPNQTKYHNCNKQQQSSNIQSSGQQSKQTSSSVGKQPVSNTQQSKSADSNPTKTAGLGIPFKMTDLKTDILKTEEVSKMVSSLEDSASLIQGKVGSFVPTGLIPTKTAPNATTNAPATKVEKPSGPKTVWDCLSKNEQKKLQEMGLDKDAVNGLSKDEVDQILSVMVESENPNSTGSKNPSRESSRTSSPTRHYPNYPQPQNVELEKKLAEVSGQVSAFFDATKSEEKWTKEKTDSSKPSMKRVLSEEQQKSEQRRLENERRLAEQQKLLEEEIKMEEERLRKEEEKRLAEQKRRKEMQEKIEAERKRLEQERIEEEERWRREEEERIRREEEERIRREEEERIRREEERIRREEEERIRREEERIKCLEEERIRREEEERIRREEEEERIRREKERMRHEDDARFMREEEDRKRRDWERNQHDSEDHFRRERGRNQQYQQAGVAYNQSSNDQDYFSHPTSRNDAMNSGTYPNQSRIIEQYQEQEKRRNKYGDCDIYFSDEDIESDYSVEEAARGRQYQVNSSRSSFSNEQEYNYNQQQQQRAYNFPQADFEIENRAGPKVSAKQLPPGLTEADVAGLSEEELNMIMAVMARVDEDDSSSAAGSKMTSSGGNNINQSKGSEKTNTTTGGGMNVSSAAHEMTNAADRTTARKENEQKKMATAAGNKNVNDVSTTRKEGGKDAASTGSFGSGAGKTAENSHGFGHSEHQQLVAASTSERTATRLNDGAGSGSSSIKHTVPTFSETDDRGMKTTHGTPDELRQYNQLEQFEPALHRQNQQYPEVIAASKSSSGYHTLPARENNAQQQQQQHYQLSSSGVNKKSLASRDEPEADSGKGRDNSGGSNIVHPFYSNTTSQGSLNASEGRHYETSSQPLGSYNQSSSSSAGSMPDHFPRDQQLQHERKADPANYGTPGTVISVNNQSHNHQQSNNNAASQFTNYSTSINIASSTNTNTSGNVATFNENYAVDEAGETRNNIAHIATYPYGQSAVTCQPYEQVSTTELQPYSQQQSQQQSQSDIYKLASAAAPHQTNTVFPVPVASSSSSLQSSIYPPFSHPAASTSQTQVKAPQGVQTYNNSNNNWETSQGVGVSFKQPPGGYVTSTSSSGLGDPYYEGDSISQGLGSFSSSSSFPSSSSCYYDSSSFVPPIYASASSFVTAASPSISTSSGNSALLSTSSTPPDNKTNHYNSDNTSYHSSPPSVNKKPNITTTVPTTKDTADAFVEHSQQHQNAPDRTVQNRGKDPTPSSGHNFTVSTPSQHYGNAPPSSINGATSKATFETSSEHKSLSDSCGYDTQGYNANEDATSEAIYANLPFQKGEAPLANYDNSEDIHSPDQQQYIAFPYVDDPTFGSNNASRRSRLKPSSHHSNSRSQSNASNSIGNHSVEKKVSANSNSEFQDHDPMNPQLLLKRGEETAANFSKMFQKANSAISNLAEDFSYGMNYGAAATGSENSFNQPNANASLPGDQYNNQLAVAARDPTAQGHVTEVTSSEVTSCKVCIQCNVTKLEQSAEQSNGHFCLLCSHFVCLQCCKLVTNPETKRKQWLCLYCHKGTPRVAPVFSGQKRGSGTELEATNDDIKPFDQKSSAANLSSFFLDGDYLNFQKSQKELKKQSSTEEANKQSTNTFETQNVPKSQTSNVDQTPNISAAFDDFDPNEYLAQLDANWSTNEFGTTSNAGQTHDASGDSSLPQTNTSNHQKQQQHVITWSSTSSWKPKNQNGASVQETSINGDTNQLQVSDGSQSDLSSSPKTSKSPNRVMPPLPKNLQKNSNLEGEEKCAAGAPLAAHEQNDWNNTTTSDQLQNKQHHQQQQSVVYDTSSHGNMSQNDYCYYDYGGYDDSQYYDYESYNSGYYDHYGNWVQQNQPMYKKHDFEQASNDYENIVEKRNEEYTSNNSSSSSGNQTTPGNGDMQMFEQSTFDIPSGVICERKEEDNAANYQSEPIYENTEIMYSLTQESSDQYSQELMDIAATYPDHYSSEEESSDVELIEEGSMGRYSTFSNLSTAKEKKTAENKDPSAANGLVSDDVTTTVLHCEDDEEEILDPDSNNFVQYQQEQEISAALAKAGRHPRTPLCTLIESSEEDEELTDYGVSRNKKKVLDIPNRPTRSEMLQKLEELQAGIEQKSAAPAPKAPTREKDQQHSNRIQSQARSNQIITVEAPKSSQASNTNNVVPKRTIQTSTQTAPKSALKSNPTSIPGKPSPQATISPANVPTVPTPITTSGQTSLYYRLAKDMISEHYNAGKSTHSHSLAQRLDIGQTPLSDNPTSVASSKTLYKSTSADTSDLTSWSSGDGPPISSSYVMPPPQTSHPNTFKCTISTQTTSNDSPISGGTQSPLLRGAGTSSSAPSSKNSRSTETQSSTSGGPETSASSTQTQVKEKRVKFLEKRTWSLPETEEDSEVGSRSLAVNVDRVLIRGNSWEEPNDSADAPQTKTKSTGTSSEKHEDEKMQTPKHSSMSNSGLPDKARKSTGKRVLPQPTPEEIEQEENSNRFGWKTKARPLRNDEVDILKKRLLTPSSKDRGESRKHRTESGTCTSSNSGTPYPLQSILKKDTAAKSSEVRGRRMTSTSVQADDQELDKEEDIGYMSASSVIKSRLASTSDTDRYSPISRNSRGDRAGSSSSTTRAKSESKYEKYKADVEILPKRKFSAEEDGNEDALLQQLKNKIRYLENCKRENFETQTGMTLGSEFSRDQNRLGSPRRNPDISSAHSHHSSLSATNQNLRSAHLALPTDASRLGRTSSPNQMHQPIVHIEEPNPLVNYQKKKVHQELKYLVDDLQRRQLTEARRALTSITTHKTTDLEKYAYPKGKGLIWVAAQAVKPKVTNNSVSPMSAMQTSIPAPVPMPSPIPQTDPAFYSGQIAQPDQVIVTPGFATGATFVAPTPPTLMLPGVPLTRLPTYAPPAVGDLILSASLGNRIFAANSAIPTTSRLYIDPNMNSTETFISTRDRLMLSPGQSVSTSRYVDTEFDNFHRSRIADTNGFVPGFYNPSQAVDLANLNSFYAGRSMLPLQSQEQALARVAPPGFENDLYNLRTQLTPQDPAVIKRDSKLELIASLQQQLDDLYRVELYRSAVDGTSTGQNQQQPSPIVSSLGGSTSISELKKSIDQRWQQLDQSSALLRNLSASRLAQTLGQNQIMSSNVINLNNQPSMDSSTSLMSNTNLNTLYDPFPVRDISNNAPNIIVEEIATDSGSVISSPNQVGTLVTSPPTYSTAFNQLQSTIMPLIQQSSQTQQIQAQINQQQQQLAQTQQQLQMLQQQTQQIQQGQQNVVSTITQQNQDGTINTFHLGQQVPGAVVPHSNTQTLMVNQPNSLFDPNAVVGVKTQPTLALTPLQQHQQQAFSLGEKDAPDFGNNYAAARALTLPKATQGAIQTSGLIRPLEQQQNFINTVNNNPYATLSRAAVNEYANHPQWYNNQNLGGASTGTSVHFGVMNDPMFQNNESSIQFQPHQQASGLSSDNKAIHSMTDLSRPHNQGPDFLERALIKPSQLSIEDLSDGRFRRSQGQSGSHGQSFGGGTTTNAFHLQEFPTRDPGSINFNQLPLKSFRLSQDPKDRSGRSNGLGLSIVGGKIIPETNGNKVAIIQKIFPGKVAEVLNPQLQEGDIVIEWNGNSLVGKTYEEVQHIIQSKTTGDVDILVCPQAQAKSIMSKADRTAQMSVYSNGTQNPGTRKDFDFHNVQFLRGYQNPQQQQKQRQLQSISWANQNQPFPHSGARQQQYLGTSHQDLMMNNRGGLSGQSDDPIQYGNPGAKSKLVNNPYSTFPRGRSSADGLIGRSGVKVQQKGLWLEQDGSLGQGTPGNSMSAPLFHNQFGTIPLSHNERGGLRTSAYEAGQSYLQQQQQQAHGGAVGFDETPYSNVPPRAMTSHTHLLPPEMVCAEEEIRGEMQIAVAYSDETQELVVDIIQAKGLSPPSSKHLADPFVKVYLLPDRCPENKRRIRYTRGTLDPFWNQSIEYGFLPRNHLPRKYLELTVWDYDKQRTNTFLGEVIIDLGDYAVLDGRARWYMLTEHTDSPEAYLDRVHLIQRRREAAHLFGDTGTGPGGGESPLSVRKARSHSDLEKTRFNRLSEIERQQRNPADDRYYHREGGFERSQWDSDPEFLAPHEFSPEGGRPRRAAAADNYGLRARSLERQLDGGSRPMFDSDRRIKGGDIFPGAANFDHEHQLIGRLSQALANKYGETMTM